MTGPQDSIAQGDLSRLVRQELHRILGEGAIDVRSLINADLSLGTEPGVSDGHVIAQSDGLPMWVAGASALELALKIPNGFTSKSSGGSITESDGSFIDYSGPTGSLALPPVSSVSDGHPLWIRHIGFTGSCTLNVDGSDTILLESGSSVTSFGVTNGYGVLLVAKRSSSSWTMMYQTSADRPIPESLLSASDQMIGHDGTSVVALPAAKRIKIGTFTSAATGNKAVSGVGFKPSLVMFEFIGGGSGATMVMGRGAMDAGGNQWVAIAAGDAGSGSRNAETNGCIGIPASTTASTYHTKAAFVSMDNDGFTINFGTHVSGTWTYAYTAFR